MNLRPSDPEPEFVDIGGFEAVVTFQENNAVMVFPFFSPEEAVAWSAGKADVTMVDATEDGNLVFQNETLLQVPREPDGATWLAGIYVATADEGDLSGGSRGFTVYDSLTGVEVFTSGNELEHIVASIGHYPERRSGNKGNEPAGMEAGLFGTGELLFITSERSSVAFVYDAADPTAPAFKQVLPTGVGPESAIVLPDRGILAVASRVDIRGAKFRANIAIYGYAPFAASPLYPSIISDNRADGSPIPFGALSGLACGGKLAS